jgi:hypothetical protein
MSEQQAAAAQMPRYKCHKEVWALKIKEIHPGRQDGQGPGVTLVFAEPGYAALSVGEDYLQRNPKEGGYYVVYDDGYKSFSPAKAFEDGYTKVAA